MATLLIRLAGPMQSWGTRSLFDDRDTERFPSKSGVIGLLCAALGRARDEPIADLAELRMAARADRPGRLEVDFHTARDVPTAKAELSSAPGAAVGGRTVVSHRHYLSDAAFLVGIEGDETLLGAVQEALWRPKWPLALGRKSFPPGLPVALPDGVRAGDLRAELTRYPWLGAEPERESRRTPGAALVPESLEVEWECLPGEVGEPRQDHPVSFALGQRSFLVRWVRHERIPLPVEVSE